MGWGWGGGGGGRGRGVKLTPQKKLPSKSPDLLGLKDFEKMTSFCKSFCPFFSNSLQIHFNPSQNVSPVLFLSGLVIVTNEGSIVCKRKGIFALISLISFIFEIIQVLLAIKNH